MADPRWLDETEMRAWRGHLQMTWLLEAAVARDLGRAAGLSHADYYVLATLSEAPARRVRMSDLAIGIQWSKSRVSHQVARMEARGLVRRDNCPSDARGTFAAITPLGLRAITEAAPEHVESIRRHLLDGLTPEQVAELADITETVLAHLHAACASAGHGSPDEDGCAGDDPGTACGADGS